VHPVLPASSKLQSKYLGQKSCLPNCAMSSPSNAQGGTGGEEKNTEIWSTRLQRELLAMTTDNVTDETKKEITDVLPSFCIVKENSLDIERGNCTVTCILDLPKAKEGKTGGSETTTEGDNNSTDPISITFDVSLRKKTDGTVDPSAVSYPFLKPIAILTSGSARFPSGSTVQDGDFIDVEIDWTPTLHLSDAIMNVALTIKECQSQGEPIHASKASREKTENAMSKAKKLGSTFGASIRNLKSKAGRKKRASRQKATASEVRIGDEINMLEAPWVDCQGVYSCKAIRRPKFAEEAIKVAAAKANQNQESDKQEVRSGAASLLDESSDQGPVPEAFGDFMRLQAGSVSQVCR